MTDLASYTVAPINVAPLDDDKCYRALALSLANRIYRDISAYYLDNDPELMLQHIHFNDVVTASAENYITIMIQDAFYEFFRTTSGQRWSVDSATETLDKLLYTKGCPEFSSVDALLDATKDFAFVDARIFMNTLIAQGELRKVILEALVGSFHAPLSFCIGAPYVD